MTVQQQVSTPISVPALDLERLCSLVAVQVRERYTPQRLRGLRVPLHDVHREALQDLSALFTSDRTALPPAYLTQPRYRGAYLLYFTATGVATVATALRQAKLPLATNRVLRVLDLGAGPLTASLAVALTLDPRVHLDVTAVDSVMPVLEDGRVLLQALRPEASARLIDGNLREGRVLQALREPFDLILMANILNEWTIGGKKRQSAAEFVQRLLTRHLAAGGAALMVEPATRTGSHTLVDVREHLLSATRLAVLAPCMGLGPCPVHSASMRDWCHSEQPWHRPGLVRELDDAIGHRRSTLKFSYLAVADASTQRQPPHRYRVIGGAMEARGQFRRYLCGEAGKVVATADAEDLARAAPLRTAWRGDALDVQGDLRPGHRGRVEETVLVPKQPQR